MHSNGAVGIAVSIAVLLVVSVDGRYYGKSHQKSGGRFGNKQHLRGVKLVQIGGHEMMEEEPAFQAPTNGLFTLPATRRRRRAEALDAYCMQQRRQRDEEAQRQDPLLRAVGEAQADYNEARELHRTAQGTATRLGYSRDVSIQTAREAEARRNEANFFTRFYRNHQLTQADREFDIRADRVFRANENEAIARAEVERALRTHTATLAFLHQEQQRPEWNRERRWYDESCLNCVEVADGGLCNCGAPPNTC